MATMQKFPTKKEGVRYVIGTGADGEPEKIYYVLYKKNGRLIEDKVGRERADRMTPYKASKIRLRKITGLEPSNVERRAQEKAAKEAEEGRYTFDRLWREWLADPENKDKRGNLKADYRYKKHIKSLFGDREPKDISVLDIDRLRLSLAKTHAKDTTRSVISLISRIANYGAKRELCPGLLFRIDLKKKQLGREPKQKRVPSDEQIREYVETAREWPDKQIGNLVLLEYYTGMRRGSAWRLKWEDVRLKEKRILLEKTKDGTDVLIPIDPELVTILENHPRKSEENPYVFTGRGEGEMLSEKQLVMGTRAIRDAAGLPKDMDPNHWMRRNLATQLNRKGVPTAYIKAAGGWKTDAMVAHYTKVDDEALRDAISVMSQALRKTEEETG